MSAHDCRHWQGAWARFPVSMIEPGEDRATVVGKCTLDGRPCKATATCAHETPRNRTLIELMDDE